MGHVAQKTNRIIEAELDTTLVQRVFKILLVGVEVDRRHRQDETEDRVGVPRRVAGGEDAALANAEQRHPGRAVGGPGGGPDGGDRIAEMVFRVIGEVAALLGPAKRTMLA